MRDPGTGRDAVARDELAVVLALHGAVANGAAWSGLSRALGPGIPVDAPDLPGHGARRGERFDLVATVDEIVGRVRAETRRVVLVGDSLGGYLALFAAARLGTSLRGVVAGGCSFAFDGWRRIAALATIVPERLVTVLAGRRRLEAAFARLAGGEVAARGLALEQRPATLRALLDADVLAAVAQIRVPVIYVDGAADPSRIDAARFDARTRCGSRRIVPYATHGVGATHPAAFATAVRELVEDEGAG